MATLVIGASGAIGQELCRALAARGTHVIACVRKTPLPADLATDASVVTELGVDVTDLASLQRVVAAHGGAIGAVWNLAAPLSVDTAGDPAQAARITEGGMANLLAALGEGGVSEDCVVCFTDSIGSFGEGSPREGATGRWLTEHPDHDPGSDYGRQKRACRALLAASGFDTRFAVVPGVLHADDSWGGGTTEYVLDAIEAARAGQPFVCPVALDTLLPMIDRRDLIRGLLALQDASRADVAEPQGGYSIAGYSVTARQVLQSLGEHFPALTHTVEASGPAATFAELWCDSLSPAEALRDFHFEAAFAWEDTLVHILATRAGPGQEMGG